MTTLTLVPQSKQGKDAGSDACSARERPRTPSCAALQAPDRGSAGDDATLTLGRLVERAWEGLHRTGGVTGSGTCPVCSGRMEQCAGAAACRDCGARLW